MALDQARDRLTHSQVKLVRSLTGHGDVPDGWDAARLQATADALARKRARAIVRVWPARRRLAYRFGIFRGLHDLIPKFCVSISRIRIPPEAKVRENHDVIASSFGGDSSRRKPRMDISTEPGVNSSKRPQLDPGRLPTTTGNRPSDWFTVFVVASCELAGGVFFAFLAFHGQGWGFWLASGFCFCLNLWACSFNDAFRLRAQQRAMKAATRRESIQAIPVNENGWQPGSAVNLLDNPAASDCVFFVLPPSEIGQVVAAGSSLRQGVKPHGISFVLFASAGVGLGVTLTVFALLWTMCYMADKEVPLFLGALCLFFGIIGACVGWEITYFRHDCCYVGMEGVSRFVCAGRRDRLVDSEVFLFKDATDLRKSVSWHGGNGKNKPRPIFHHDWHDLMGNYCFEITYGRSDDLSYTFALAAEDAWNKYQELKRTERSD